MVRVGGATIRAGQLVPHAGGYQTLLDSKVLDYLYGIIIKISLIGQYLSQQEV